METRGEAAGRGAWRVVGRVLVTLVAAVVIGYWVLFALFLWAFRCDESCSGGEAYGWHWTGQLVLAVTGSLVAVAGLVVAVQGSRSTARRVWCVSAACALAWIAWLYSGSF